MALLSLAAGLAAIVTALYYAQTTGTNRFVPNACSNVATHLPALVVGQNNAIDHLVTVVCEHLRDNAQIDAERSSTMLPQGSPTAFGAGKAAGGNEYELRRRKPLFISVHGPPGTGKTFTHTLLAKALYNRDLATAKSCPGEGCAGAKVLYGITYTAEERSGQLAMVREAILDHLRSTPQALLVIEEYDKLDCASRSMLRQLVQHPEIVNLDLSHSIIMLESNLGFLQLANLLREANGDKSQIPPEAADRILRNVSLTAWRAANCEGIGDTVAFAATVDHYVAFYPLTRGEVEVLLERELSFNYARRAARLGGTLVWEPAAVRWLADRVDYDNNNFPLEGASQVSARCVRYVAPLFRVFETGHMANGTAEPSRALEFRLVVQPGETHLVLLRTQANTSLSLGEGGEK